MGTRQSSRSATKLLLAIVVAIVVLMAIGFLYWASTGDPVQAPQAPAGETTIPNR